MKRSMIILLALFAITLAACASVENDATTPLNPVEDEGDLTRGEAFVSSTQLLILESDPLQIKLLVKGSLPTPCHQLRSNAAKPDEQNRINVELYSLVDPEAICIQVLQSFETEISLGSYPAGSYTVWLNGEQVGEFTE